MILHTQEEPILPPIVFQVIVPIAFLPSSFTVYPKLQKQICKIVPTCLTLPASTEKEAECIAEKAG